MFYIECKYRKLFACRKWFYETKKRAKKENKIPLLIIKERGKEGELVICDWDWLCEVINDRK